MVVNCERVSFVGRAAIRGRDAHRRRERSEFVPGHKLDSDGLSIRPRVANRRHDAQPRARVISKQNRSTIGATSVLVYAIVVPDRNAKSRLPHRTASGRV